MSRVERGESVSPSDDQSILETGRAVFSTRGRRGLRSVVSHLGKQMSRRRGGPSNVCFEAAGNQRSKASSSEGVAAVADMLQGVVQLCGIVVVVAAAAAPRTGNPASSATPHHCHHRVKNDESSRSRYLCEICLAYLLAPGFEHMADDTSSSSASAST